MGKFATCLNCIDGRTHLPVITWIKHRFKFDYVDLITEPGMDGYLAKNNPIDPNIVRKIEVSIERNRSKHLFIVGHEDCKGNPQDEATHMVHIRSALNKLGALNIPIDITGLWVGLDGNVREIPTNN